MSNSERCKAYYRRNRDRLIKKAHERRRAYYLANREQIIAKVKGYYQTHRAQMVAKAVERNRRRFKRVPGQRKPRAVKPNMLKNVVPFVREQAKGWTDKEWWKLPKDEIPRRWILEAA